jgi:hypothetical protein
MAAAYLFPCRQGKYTFSHLKSPSHREDFFHIRGLRRFSRVRPAVEFLPPAADWQRNLAECVLGGVII